MSGHSQLEGNHSVNSERMLYALKWMGVELVEVSIKEKLISTIGSTLAIYLVFLITTAILPANATLGVVASMGATAVLLFAVPHGQLSQPWPVLGGHLISAMVGVLCARWITNPTLATALAVGISIGLMHQFKCIHPPGGATAFTAVMGGQAIHALGFNYVLFPVALNAVVMLLLAVAINYPYRWRRYPAILIQRSTQECVATEHITEEDHRSFVEAIRSLDSFVDVSEEDLVYLARMMAERYVDRIAGRIPAFLVQPHTQSDNWMIASDEDASRSTDTDPTW